MKKQSVTLLTMLSILLLTAGILTAQDKMDHSKMSASTKDCCKSSDKDSSSCMQKDKAHNMQSMEAKMMDKNKDGKVFQCSMCPDVVTDEPGTCPKCEMDLTEASPEEAQKAMGKNGHDMMEQGKMDHSKMEMKKDSIVREGEIDLAVIDKNGDKKVFQDQMDWNVISDEAGRCPLCDMKLKEISQDAAKANLIQHGFKVK